MADTLRLKLNEWLPDQPDYDNSGLTVATNTIATAKGYKPVKSLADFSNAGDSRLRGVFASEDSSGNAVIFAGNETKLYKYNGSTNNLDDVSKSGGYSLGTNERWRFAQFDSKIIAVGGQSQTIQVFDLNTSSLFEDIATGVNARFVAVVRDFVFTGHNSTGLNNTRWSGLGDSTTWASSQATQADNQSISDLGAVTGIVGGEDATIFCETGIVVARYVGTPLIFQFSTVESNRGCNFAGSIVNVAKNIYYYTDDGFYVFNQRNGSVPIGFEKVDRFFQNDFNTVNKHRLYSAVDPQNKVIMWAYPSKSSASGDPDKILVFNYALNKWSLLTEATDLLASILTPATTLEGLDAISGNNLDSMTTSLDSDAFKGGNLLFAGSNSNKIQTFTGTNLAMTLTTGEFEHSNKRISMIKEVRPFYEKASTDSTTISVQLASRNTTFDDFSFGSALSVNADGFAPSRQSGRYHRVQVNLSGDFTSIQRLDLDLETLGRR